MRSNLQRGIVSFSEIKVLHLFKILRIYTSQGAGITDEAVFAVIAKVSEARYTNNHLDLSVAGVAYQTSL
jgi:hypothetical protein